MAGSVLPTEMNRMCSCAHFHFGDHFSITFPTFLSGNICVPAMIPSNTGPAHQGLVIIWSTQDGCKCGGKGEEASSFLSGE